MRKILVVLLGAGALAACSSVSSPQSGSSYKDCSDAKAEIKDNHIKLDKAFAHRDANTIGTLELRNRDVIHSNLKCFPSIDTHISNWKKIHKDLER